MENNLKIRYRGRVKAPADSSPAAGQARDSLLSRIGNTPLIRLPHLREGISEGVKIFAKAEWFNPGGSVKDRAALAMIEAGERTGELNHRKTIIEATSGNTGIALAMIGAARGYRVRLAMPANASPARKTIITAYGAELVLTDPMEGTDGAQRYVKQFLAEAADPESWFYPDQYNNNANWQAHYNGTAVEIMAQTEGRITHFVAGLGTTGTFVGTARRLREHDPSIAAISFQPESPYHALEGLKHMETAITPGIYDAALADKNITVRSEEALLMTRRLARETGIFAGISSGAAMVAAQRLARGIDQGVIITIFPDGGNRYITEELWENTADE